MSAAQAPAFGSAGTRRQFFLFCLATFLLYLSFSETTLLAIMLEHHGTSSATETNVLAASGLAVVITSWSMGGLLQRYGPRAIVVVGALVQIAAFVSFEYTLFNPIWAVVSRLFQGMGHGLFFASSLLLAQNYLSRERMV